MPPSRSPHPALALKVHSLKQAGARQSKESTSRRGACKAYLELQAVGEDEKAGTEGWGPAAVWFSAAALPLKYSPEGGPAGSYPLPAPFGVHLCAGAAVAAGA